MLSNKQSGEKVLIERAVKTTVQVLYDEGFFNNFDNADELFKDCLFAERRKPDSHEVIDDVFQWFNP